MTTQEAIKVLKKELHIIDDPNVTMTAREWDEHDDNMRDALNMAIEALSNFQKQSDSLIRTSADDVSEADVIYRADAIDAVKKNTFLLTFAEEQNCEGHVAWSAEAVYSVMDEYPTRVKRMVGLWVISSIECVVCLILFIIML